MFYDKQPKENQKNYKAMLTIIGSLSKIFSESDVPYLYYRAHENIFAKYFGLINNSRSDDSADAYSTVEKVGIGLKTWVGQDNQKVAEFGRLRPTYANLKGMELIRLIAEYRNERIRVTKNVHGLDTLLYHIVKRTSGAMRIYETNFDPIDIEHIIIDENRGNENSTYFSDGKHVYHFSLSKNTLYMIFEDMELLDSFDVNIVEDPYDVLSDLMKKRQTETQTDENSVDVALHQTFSAQNSLCLRLYSTKHDGTKFIAEKSGLNQWNGVRTQFRKGIKIGEKPRNPNELYIPYPAKDRKRGDFFPPRDEPFELLLPNGQWISAKVCQQGGKAIMSNPNETLGKWLLRDVFELDEGTVVTYNMLQIFGIDSVMFTKLDSGKYSVDFCSLGTYEKFYKLNDNN